MVAERLTALPSTRRRDFLRCAYVAFSSSALVEYARGESQKSVIAETSLGKIRGSKALT